MHMHLQNIKDLNCPLPSFSFSTGPFQWLQRAGYGTETNMA